jgi:hypothetical protein
MEFHENRARQPFIGFVLLGGMIKKWWLRSKRADFAANERRTAERCRAASGSDQLKSAIFFAKRAIRALPRVTRLYRELHSQIYQLMLLRPPFLDTYPDKYYFLLNNEEKT